MYCINCGVQLADTEKVCPLCETEVYHPRLRQGEGRPLYPAGKAPAAVPRAWGGAVVLTVLYLLPMIIVLLCDGRVNGGLTWSGYVIGAMVLAYVIFFLPLWFRRPNPIVFVPCGFGAAGLYVLYIDLATGGGWYLSFALPVLGFFALLVTAVVTLWRCLRRGKLYVAGGAVTALGLFMPLMEFLMAKTFRLFPMAWWSLYPAAALVLLGALLLFLAICRPAREYMERKLFF